MTSAELLEISRRDTLASVNYLAIDVNGIEFQFRTLLKHLSNYHYHLKYLKKYPLFPNSSTILFYSLNGNLKDVYS